MSEPQTEPSPLVPPLLSIEHDKLRAAIKEYEEAGKDLSVARRSATRKEEEEIKAAAALVDVLVAYKLPHVVYNGCEYSRGASKRLFTRPCDILFLDDGVIVEETEQIEHGVNCEKVVHKPGHAHIYRHGDQHDSLCVSSGNRNNYCGRCHELL